MSRSFNSRIRKAVRDALNKYHPPGPKNPSPEQSHNEIPEGKLRGFLLMVAGWIAVPFLVNKITPLPVGNWIGALVFQVLAVGSAFHFTSPGWRRRLALGFCLMLLCFTPALVSWVSTQEKANAPEAENIARDRYETLRKDNAEIKAQLAKEERDKGEDFGKLYPLGYVIFWAGPGENAIPFQNPKGEKFVVDWKGWAIRFTETEIDFDMPAIYFGGAILSKISVIFPAVDKSGFSVTLDPRAPNLFHGLRHRSTRKGEIVQIIKSNAGIDVTVQYLRQYKNAPILVMGMKEHK